MCLLNSLLWLILSPLFFSSSSSLFSAPVYFAANSTCLFFCSLCFFIIVCIFFFFFCTQRSCRLSWSSRNKVQSQSLLDFTQIRLLKLRLLGKLKSKGWGPVDHILCESQAHELLPLTCLHWVTMLATGELRLWTGLLVCQEVLDGCILLNDEVATAGNNNRP